LHSKPSPSTAERKISGMDTNEKGAIAEAAVALHAVRLGIAVMRPVIEQRRYDLIFDIDGRLLRIQCKWAALRGDIVRISTRRCYHSPTRGYVRGGYGTEIDAFAGYCSELDRCYLVPMSVVGERTMLDLRLTPPRNNQQASINWAAEFELGAVAQLEERVAGSDEAVGSSPTSSIESVGAEVTLGAHEYRNRFGWYMQRASGGERFLITRRGRPFARLIPP
jgi:prevent-host-death family protein